MRDDEKTSPESLGKACLLLQQNGFYTIAAVLERYGNPALLRDLLEEWRRTPFFDDEDDWGKWVDDFHRRVDAAIGPNWRDEVSK